MVVWGTRPPTEILPIHARRNLTLSKYGPELDFTIEFVDDSSALVIRIMLEKGRDREAQL
jgi:hypothetical protein